MGALGWADYWGDAEQRRGEIQAAVQASIHPVLPYSEDNACVYYLCQCRRTGRGVGAGLICAMDPTPLPSRACTSSTKDPAEKATVQSVTLRPADLREAPPACIAYPIAPYRVHCPPCQRWQRLRPAEEVS